jgi:very-short-patch-repair endonuclease
MSVIDCKICGKELEYISYNHLKSHGYTNSQYLSEFPSVSVWPLDRIHPLQGTTHRGWNEGKKLNITPEGRTKLIENGRRQGLSNIGRKHPNHPKGYKANLSVEGRESLRKYGRIRGLSCKGRKTPDEVKQKLSAIFKGRSYEEMFGKDKADDLKKLRLNNYNNTLANLTLEERRKNTAKGASVRKLRLLNPERYNQYCQTCSKAHKEAWTRHDYIYAHTRNKKPTKPEIKLGNLLDEITPNQFGYNGNYKLGVSLGRRIPDFVNINGKKQVIELFGDYWHRNDSEDDKISHYHKLGYSCLIVWENELKNNVDKLSDKIISFVGGDPFLSDGHSH